MEMEMVMLRLWDDSEGKALVIITIIAIIIAST